VLKTPVRAPKANAFAERFVCTIRAEVFDLVLVTGRRHLIKVLSGTRSTTTPTDRIAASTFRLRR
jgi:hypothetical protein